MINFSTTGAERALIDKIADRAVAVAKAAGVKYPEMDAAMDITACHKNGNPLRLQALLDADDFNFSHDVFGIRRHLDRTTGTLQDFFSPRFSA